MKRNQLLSALAVVLFAAASLAAQQAPGTLTTVEFQKIKSGMTPQYEAGRKQKAAWHKQQNDPLPLYVWETISGEHMGDFVVGRFGQRWADFDKPVVTDEADVAEFQKVMGAYVDSLTLQYYDFLPKVSSLLDAGNGPAKFSEIVVFQVRYGKHSDFRSAMERIHDATVKTKWPVSYEWYALVDGGLDGTFVLAFPHNTWADFDDKPDAKPYREMLKDAYGQAEADSIVDRIDHSVEKVTSYILKFRPDLSYIPAK